MNITDVRIRLLKAQKSGLAGFAAVAFDNQLVIKDFAIFEHSGNITVLMPSKKMPDGLWRETVQPICSEFNGKLKSAIIRAYTDERARPENNPIL